MSRFLFVILFLFSIHPLLSQELNKKIFDTTTSVEAAKSIDSLFHVCLPDVDVYPSSKSKKNKRYYRRYKKRYSRLEQKVKKVHPYAKLASEKLKKYNEQFLSFETEKDRKKYAKSIEKELKEEFEMDLKKLKISEGRILIKLIDREAGINSYQIIKEFRGGVQAFFWQTVASLFGHDLKAEYDAVEEDRMIEEILKKIELTSNR